MRSARQWLGVAGTLALAVAPALVLVTSAGPAGAVPAGDETSFRTAWDTATQIELTADITLTCAGGGDAARSSNADVVLDGMGHTIAMEAGCIRRVLRNGGDGATTLRNVRITGGRTNDDGGGYEHNGTGSLTFDRVTVADNTACAEGGGVEVENSVQVTVIASTFTGNISGSESAIDLDEGGDLLIVNSTFTGNIANQHGAIYAEDGSSNTITLVYSTIVANVETQIVCVASVDPDEEIEATEPVTEEATEPTTTSTTEAPTPPTEPDEGTEPTTTTTEPPASATSQAEVEPEDVGDDVAPQAAGEPANVDFDNSYTLQSFATVIALPQGTGAPTPNCGTFANATVSSGYNFSDDATCGFTNTAAGDRENAGDPLVGPLTDNGGPTQTRLPDGASPLVNFIPPTASGGGNGLAGFAITTDQRGIARPQSTGAEIGAVELEQRLDFTG